MAWRADVLHAYVSDEDGARAEIARALPGRSLVFVDDATLDAALPDVEVLLCGWPPRVDWARARRLRLLHFMGAGIDRLWPAKGLGPDVVIANARGMHANEMRDHALAMILAFERDLPGTLKRQAAKDWAPVALGTVAGKTALVMGLGEVGAPIARACRALGVHVLGMRATDRPSDDVDELVPLADLRAALARSHYVVVTVPLTSRTRGLVGKQEIATMHGDAVIVAISRGGVVVEADLVDALARGALRGAALDVFEHEPLPETSPLWTMPNVIVTPHIAGWMPGYVGRAARVFADNLARMEQGLPVRTPVDRAREY